MGVQTTIKDYVYIPDGCKVQIKESGAADYTDLGAVEGDVTCTLEYDVNKVESANAGVVINSIKNMKMTGGFTLMNLNPANLVRLSSGIFTATTTAASENSSIPDQTIAAGWALNTPYELIMYTSSTDSTKLKMATAPALTSVTLNAGSPEALVETSEYVVIADSNSYSGWSLVIIAATTGSPTTYSITVNYAANTPRASTTIACGSSTVTMTASAMKFTHTDSSSLTRELELFSVTPQSGGMQFNYKGATSDGVETMPLTFEANIDSTRTDGQQLMTWKVDNGAD